MHNWNKLIKIFYSIKYFCNEKLVVLFKPYTWTITMIYHGGNCHAWMLVSGIQGFLDYSEGATYVANQVGNDNCFLHRRQWTLIRPYILHHNELWCWFKSAIERSPCFITMANIKKGSPISKRSLQIYKK